MRLLCLLVLIMAILAGYCYGHAKADTTDQVMSVETASKPLIFNGDKANRYLKGDKETSEELTGVENEERGGLGKLKAISQKSPTLGKIKTQGKTSNLNKVKAAALKDPQIELKNPAGKIEITNRDAKSLRSFAAKNPLQGLNLIEKLIALAMMGLVVGGFAVLISLIPKMLSTQKT